METEPQNTEVISSLIGKFGVGFYSSFMVADKVVLVTRKAGTQEATRWESSGDGEFEVSEGHRHVQGTSVTLYLKPHDAENQLEDFTQFWTVSRVVRRYSDFVRYPIIMKHERKEHDYDDEDKIVEGSEPKTIIEDKTLNSMKPLWTRTASEVTEDEHAEFYKQLSHDWEKPLKTLHFNVEGRLEYKALLYLPQKAPQDLYHHIENRGLRLYVRNVMIMEHCADLLPSYLRFVQGVIDSADLPLNVSREMIQQDRHITQIRKFLTKKVLDACQKMFTDERETYLEFWKQFGRPLKEGVINDYENRDTLVDLLLFASSANPTEMTTLKQYVERMKEGQKEIFYISGNSREEVERSPHLEAFQEHGYEVIYLWEPIDEMAIQSLYEYQEHQFKSITTGDIELGNEEEKAEKKKQLDDQKAEYKEFLSFLEKQLSEQIKEVRLSSRLTTSPACLVGDQDEISPHLERLLRMRGEELPKKKRYLEINPNHQLIMKMHRLHTTDPDSSQLQSYPELLLGYALIAEGSKLHDPARFNTLLSEIIQRELE
jgi:molecular chaperone HtpG